jgi:hypothetical protein
MTAKAVKLTSLPARVQLAKLAANSSMPSPASASTPVAQALKPVRMKAPVQSIKMVSQSPISPAAHRSAPLANIVKPARWALRAPRSADNVVSIQLDRAPLYFALAPYIAQDRTMAMLRPLIDASGGTLAWSGNVGMAQIQQHHLTFTLSQRTALLDGKPILLARPLIKLDDRVFAPVSFWHALLGGVVEFYPTPHIVKIYHLK